MLGILGDAIQILLVSLGEAPKRHAFLNWHFAFYIVEPDIGASTLTKLFDKLVRLNEHTVRAIAVIRDDGGIALNVNLGTAVSFTVAGDLDLMRTVQALDRNA